MAGHKSVRVLDEKLGPERLAQARAKAREMMAEMVLAELRREADMTQTELAKALGVSQPAISDMESQSDMQISTLRHLIKALGGEMEISIRMSGATYRLGGLG